MSIGNNEEKKEFENTLEGVEELQRLITFLKSNMRNLVYTVIICMVFFVSVRLWINYKSVYERRAMQLLFDARKEDDIRQVIERFRGSKAEPLAYLKLAKINYDTGKYSEAMEFYDRFQALFPKHEFLPAAKLGKIHCIEGLGRYGEALSAYIDFVGVYSNHYLTAEAVLGQSRCFEALGQIEKARAVCEDFMLSKPDSSWNELFKDKLKVMEKKSKYSAPSTIDTKIEDDSNRNIKENTPVAPVIPVE